MLIAKNSKDIWLSLYFIKYSTEIMRKLNKFPQRGIRSQSQRTWAVDPPPRGSERPRDVASRYNS